MIEPRRRRDINVATKRLNYPNMNERQKYIINYIDTPPGTQDASADKKEPKSGQQSINCSEDVAKGRSIVLLTEITSE